MTSNRNLFARHERAQHELALRTLPTAGVVEYDDTPILNRIPAEALTGPTRRAQLQLTLAIGRADGWRRF